MRVVLFLMLLFMLPIVVVSQYKSARYMVSKQSFIINNDSSLICVENKGSRTGNVFFSINDQFADCTAAVISAIHNMPGGDPDWQKAWRYVVKNTFHSDTITSQPWIHHPLLFLNSPGYGFCDDRASVLAALWKEMGYESRVWNLNGHVVPEVLINNRYEMYDPDLEVFYTGEKSQVLGVEEISQKALQVMRAGDRKASLRSCVHAYSETTRGFYSTANDNKVDTFYDQDIKQISFDVTMPPGSALYLPVNRSMNSNQRLYLKNTAFYVLPQGFTGAVRFPYVICSVSGKGILNYGNRSVVIEGKTSFPHNAYSEILTINESQKPLVIEFFINPLLSSVDSLAEVKIFADTKMPDLNTEVRNDSLFRSRNIFWYGNDSIACQCITRGTKEISNVEVVNRESLVEKVKKYIVNQTCTKYSTEEQSSVLRSIEEIYTYADQIGKTSVLYEISNNEPLLIYNLEKLRINKNYLKVILRKFGRYQALK